MIAYSFEILIFSIDLLRSSAKYFSWFKLRLSCSGDSFVGNTYVLVLASCHLTVILYGPGLFQPHPLHVGAAEPCGAAERFYPDGGRHSTRRAHTLVCSRAALH